MSKSATLDAQKEALAVAVERAVNFPGAQGEHTRRAERSQHLGRWFGHKVAPTQKAAQPAAESAVQKFPEEITANSAHNQNAWTPAQKMAWRLAQAIEGDSAQSYPEPKHSEGV